MRIQSSALKPEIIEAKITANIIISDEEVLEDNTAHKAAIANKDMPQREFRWVQINGGYSKHHYHQFMKMYYGLSFKSIRNMYRYLEYVKLNCSGQSRNIQTSKL